MKLRSVFPAFSRHAVLLVFRDGSLCAKEDPAADTIVLHGKIYTLNPKTAVAEALAIRGERIVAVGSDTDIANLRSKDTKVIDAKSHLVLPASPTATFISSTAHSVSDASISKMQKMPLTFSNVCANMAASIPGAIGFSAADGTMRCFPHRFRIKNISMKFSRTARPSLRLRWPHLLGKFESAHTRAYYKRHAESPNGIIVRDPQTGEATAH